MIEPRPGRLVQWWFDGWARRAMARQFYRLHVWGEWPSTAVATPRLYAVNHSSFWDGIVLWRLLHRRHPGLLCAVDERQMLEHPFFARLGCFSIDRSRPRRAVESLDYAARRLREPGAAMVIFPQGRIEHVDARPLRVERGVARLITKAAGLEVVPVSIRYDWWQEQRGEILLQVGPAATFAGTEAFAGLRDERTIGGELSSRLVAGLDALAERSRRYEAAPRVLRVGPASISHWRERLPLRRAARPRAAVD